MIDPIHEITIPLNKAVNAEYLAQFAGGEHGKAIHAARCSRYHGDSEMVHFWLNDAAEWRRVYQACTQAIDVMGGL
jgi:hypothetical protein